MFGYARDPIEALSMWPPPVVSTPRIASFDRSDLEALSMWPPPVVAVHDVDGAARGLLESLSEACGFRLPLEPVIRPN